MKIQITLNREEFMEALACGLQDVGLLKNHTNVTGLEKLSEDKYVVRVEED